MSTRACGGVPSPACTMAKWSCKPKRLRVGRSCLFPTCFAGLRRNPSHPMACMSSSAILMSSRKHACQQLASELETFSGRGAAMRLTRHTEGPVSIAYDVEGSGPFVVFLHGIGGNRSNWAGQLAHFGTRFCAVAWDARGYGGSDDPPQTLKFSDYADDLVRLLDHLNAERAPLVGLSMGGMIIQDFYGRYADRVATLALVDTSAGFGSVSEDTKRDFLARRLDPLERGLRPADI